MTPQWRGPPAATNTAEAAIDAAKARWRRVLDGGDAAMADWLRRVYYAEIGAVGMIAQELADPANLPLGYFDGLHRVLLDETRHALMVAQVARQRGCWPPAAKARKGVFSPLDVAVPRGATIHEGAWVDLQAEAEAARRLDVAVRCGGTPEDVRRLCTTLLADERRHVQFFAEWAGGVTAEAAETFAVFARAAWGHAHLVEGLYP